MFLPYRQFHHYHHRLRMWCDYWKCLYSFLKIKVDLCFNFDLREVLDIGDFLKETTGVLKLRFDCSTIKLRKSISKIQFNGMSKVDWFNFTLINFSVNIWNSLIYERIDDLISLLAISFEHIHVLWELTEGQSVYPRILFTTLP